MVLVRTADHTSASTTVHDRGRPSRVKPDERRSVQTFEAQAQRRGVPATHESGNTRGTAKFTTMPRVKQPSSGDNALYTRWRSLNLAHQPHRTKPRRNHWCSGQMRRTTNAHQLHRRRPIHNHASVLPSRQRLTKSRWCYTHSRCTSLLACTVLHVMSGVGGVGAVGGVGVALVVLKIDECAVSYPGTHRCCS